MDPRNRCAFPFPATAPAAAATRDARPTRDPRGVLVVFRATFPYVARSISPTPPHNTHRLTHFFACASRADLSPVNRARDRGGYDDRDDYKRARHEHDGYDQGRGGYGAMPPPPHSTGGGGGGAYDNNPHMGHAGYGGQLGGGGMPPGAGMNGGGRGGIGALPPPPGPPGGGGGYYYGGGGAGGYGGPDPRYSSDPYQHGDGGGRGGPGMVGGMGPGAGDAHPGPPGYPGGYGGPSGGLGGYGDRPPGPSGPPMSSGQGAGGMPMGPPVGGGGIPSPSLGGGSDPRYGPPGGDGGVDSRYGGGGYGGASVGGGASGAPMGYGGGGMRGTPNVGSYRDGPALPPPSFAKPLGGGRGGGSSSLGLPPLAAGGASEEVMCPNEVAGKVIGHGGENINSIQTKTGAHVRIQPSSEVLPGQPRKISVQGAPGPVADAVRIIEDIIREAEIKVGSSRGGGANNVEIPVPVPQEMVGRVIGRGGETIRRLQEESGARIQVERDLNRVLIKGDPEKAQRAKELVLDIVNNPNPGGASKPDYVKHVMPAGGCEGKIIGKGGESIRDLCMRTGAKIQIDKESASVTIQGKQAQVDEAIKLVQAIIDEGPTVYMRPGGTPGQADATPYVPGGARGGGGYGAYAGDAGAGYGAGDVAGEARPKPLWETHKSPEGYTYYYNTTTGATQWDQPEDYDGVS